MVLNQGQFCFPGTLAMFRDSFDSQHSGAGVRAWEGAASGNSWMETSNASQQPTVPRTAPETENYLVQNVTRARFKSFDLFAIVLPWSFSIPPTHCPSTLCCFSLNISIINRFLVWVICPSPALLWNLPNQLGQMIELT